MLKGVGSYTEPQKGITEQFIVTGIKMYMHTNTEICTVGSQKGWSRTESIYIVVTETTGQLKAR